MYVRAAELLTAPDPLPSRGREPAGFRSRLRSHVIWPAVQGKMDILIRVVFGHFALEPWRRGKLRALTDRGKLHFRHDEPGQGAVIHIDLHCLARPGHRVPGFFETPSGSG